MRMLIGFVDVTNKKGQNANWDRIAWFQESPIVHVFLAFEESPGVFMVYETTSSQYTRRSMESRLEGSEVHLFETIGEVDVSTALEYCQSKIGMDYGYGEIVGLGVGYMILKGINWVWRKITGKTTKLFTDGAFSFIKNPFDAKDTMFCAEITMKAMRYASVRIPPYWSDASVTAPLIYRYCRRYPDEFKPFAWNAAAA